MMNRINVDKVAKLCMLAFLPVHSAIPIYPGNIKKPADQPEFHVAFSRVEWSLKDQITVLSPLDFDSIILPYHFSYLKIDFSVLPDEVNPEKKYRYAIIRDTANINWIDLGLKNYIILTHLKPGHNTIRISVSLADQDIDISPGELTIIVGTHFLISAYAIAFYIIAFIILFSAFFRLQTRALRKLTRQFRERERIAEQLMTQKEELALKNKNITDSINYAQRIQSALMPSEKQFKSILPESFILHIPRDIVSGDFYWINEVKDYIFIAAVDCTGHGVPGAFVSIIGFELFRKLTNIEGIQQPSEILNSLNNDFKEVFRDVENITLRDGMDVAFCSLNKKTRTLEFAGAFNPLYLIRDNSIIEVKGDRNSVGLDHPENDVNEFTNHTIQLQAGDIFYIFSDGFVDQFGGPEGKKYKYRRFRHLLLALHDLPMNRQHDFLYKSIVEWKGDLDQVDDILVIGIKAND
ncbi:MAG TPA: SpoIIE family protein phosphatase [Bacteroidales bacterium]|nr:SpoIIE family protein phosphatase [Bacteroidales bacterium]